MCDAPPLTVFCLSVLTSIHRRALSSSEEFARSQGRRNTAGKTAGRHRLADCSQKDDPHVAQDSSVQVFSGSALHITSIFSVNWSVGLAHVYQYGPCKGVPYSQNRLVRHSACVLFIREVRVTLQQVTIELRGQNLKKNEKNEKK